MWFYKFKCTWYDESEKATITEQGLVAGKTIADATERMVDFFGGEENFISISLEPWDNEGIVVIPENLLNEVEKESY